MRRTHCLVLSLCVLLFALTECQIAQSAFAKTAGNAGTAFAAASTTLTYTHTDKLTMAYTKSSFEGYQSELRLITLCRHPLYHLLWCRVRGSAWRIL